MPFILLKEDIKKLRFSSKANSIFLGIAISFLNVKQFGERTYSTKLRKL